MTTVPGPPRGRRRSVAEGDGLLDRVRAMRDAEQGGLSPRALLALLRDVILLLKDLATDPRVPRREKILAGAAAAYLVLPVDLVPDFIPVLGQADDWWVALTALRRLVAGAGYEVVYGLWRGTDEGLAVVLSVAGVDRA